MRPTARLGASSLETAKAINPVNPADASYALAAEELSRRGFDVTPHRRSADRRRPAPRRRAGDRPPRRAGRRARDRHRIAPVQPDELDWSRPSCALAAGWSCWGSATRTSTATTCRSCSAASASRRQHHRAGGGRPAPERRDLGARRHRRHGRPGRACRRGHVSSTAPACWRWTAPPGAGPRRHQRHRPPGRPAARRGAAGRPRPRRGLRRLDLFGDDSSRSSTTAPCGPTSSPGPPAPVTPSRTPSRPTAPPRPSHVRRRRPPTPSSSTSTGCRSRTP